MTIELTQNDPAQALDAMRVDFTPAEVPWAGGRALAHLWTEKRGDRLFPARADLSPTEMTAFLDSVVLHDVLYDPLRFRNRLIGTALVNTLGRDPTGLMVDDMPDGQSLIRRYSWVVENRKPYFCENLPLGWAGKKFLSYSTLVMPLGPHDDHVDMFVCCVKLPNPLDFM